MRKLLSVITILLFIGGMAAAESYMSDPMSIGMGARAIGMGRAYVGVAEDGEALFVNPAGIAQSVNPKISSMYTSLMGDVSYLVFAGVYPLGEKSALGAGIVNSSTGNIPLTNVNGSGAGDAQWGETVVFLSGATHLNSLALFRNLKKDILIGGNLKYFSSGGTGSNDVGNLSDASGSGYSMDLGVLVPATRFLTLGLNCQNLLASQISRGTGTNDTITTTYKIGGKLCLLGREDQAFSTHANRRLYLVTDYDIASDGLGNTLHAGLEFWPVSNFALRGGMDGDNLTAGIGVRLGGIEFNYAYHPYSGVAQDATSFFSISYLGEALKREIRVQVLEPKDKAVVYDDFVKVSGKVEIETGDESQAPAGNIVVRANGVNIRVAEDLSFSAEVPVENIGKKAILVEVMDDAGDYISSEFRVLRLINFADVPDGYWAKQPIENIGTVGLVEGYPDGTFKPENALTRAELATLMVRAKGIDVSKNAANKVFKDVPADFWAARYIEVAKAQGLITGYPDSTFRPNNKISREEGIAVMARFENLDIPVAVIERPYWDIEDSSWSAKYIQAAKQAGMLGFIEKNTLNPKESLVRAEAVEMLSKTSLAGGKVDDLYSWEKGFKREFTPIRPNTRAAL